MAVLVTRPEPDNAAIARALEGVGHQAVLAPMLRFEPVAFARDDVADFAGVIATSANALRAIAGHPLLAQLIARPLFAVGSHTAQAAKAAGFSDVVAGDSDAAALPSLVAGRFGKAGKKSAKTRDAATPPRLLYLAGADITRDLTAAFGARGIELVTCITYRMLPAERLSAPARDAFTAGRITAVLHYSRRSAQAFIAAARADGVEISALALPQCCLSDAVAQVLRDAGAARVVVARAPDEAAMLDAVARAVPATLRDAG